MVCVRRAHSPRLRTVSNDTFSGVSDTFAATMRPIQDGFSSIVNCGVCVMGARGGTSATRGLESSNSRDSLVIACSILRYSDARSVCFPFSRTNSAFRGNALAAAKPASSAMKMSFEGEIGAQPPIGYWDPLGLLLKDPTQACTSSCLSYTFPVKTSIS